MTQRAYFISIEGIEGVGKSTITQFITEQLTQAQINHVVTREPGGTPLAEAIRQVLLTPTSETICSDTELLLMFAGRAQHMTQIILPALRNQHWVVCDRFTDASFAYQGGGRGIAKTRIAALTQWVLGDFQPDLTLLLDAPVEVGLSRLNHRGHKDRIERENIEFFQRVRSTYLELAKQQPQRFRVIDVNQPLAAVKQAVLTELTPYTESP